MAQPCRRQVFGEWGKGTAFRVSYYAPHFNWLQRALLFVPLRLHAGLIDKTWDDTEKRVFQTLLTWLDPPSDLRRLGCDLAVAKQEYDAIEHKITECGLPEWRKTRLLRLKIRNSLLSFTALLLHPDFVFIPKFPASEMADLGTPGRRAACLVGAGRRW